MSAERPAAWKPRDLRSEDEIRELAKSHGRVLMGDGCYSTVMLGWAEIQTLLDEIDSLRKLVKA